MLGPELETFKGNKSILVLLVILEVLLYVLGTFIGSRPFVTTGFRLFLVSLLIWPIFFFVWVKSVRVTFHTDGISYKSFLGKKEIRWDNLERLVYGAVKQRINFVPIATYYHIKLIDADGRKLRLGNRVERTDQLGAKVIEQSYPKLYSKAVERFNMDQEVDFGAIRLSRVGGLKVKKTFSGYREIPWAEVTSCDIRQGKFYVWAVGEARARGALIRQVPNVFVLQNLINAVIKPSS